MKPFYLAIEMKICKRCGHSFESTRCRNCAREYARLYRKINAKKVNEYKVEYISQNRDKVLNRQREYQKEYRKNNKDKIKSSRNRTKESIVRYMNNRRARIANVGGKLSKGLAEKLYVLQKGKCACCRKSLNNVFHLDHILPLSLGGKNIDSNIQLLSPECNRQKHTKHPIDFMQSKGFLL